MGTQAEGRGWRAHTDHVPHNQSGTRPHSSVAVIHVRFKVSAPPAPISYTPKTSRHLKEATPAKTVFKIREFLKIQGTLFGVLIIRILHYLECYIYTVPFFGRLPHDRIQKTLGRTLGRKTNLNLEASEGGMKWSVALRTGFLLRDFKF